MLIEMIKKVEDLKIEFNKHWIERNIEEYVTRNKDGTERPNNLTESIYGKVW